MHGDCHLAGLLVVALGQDQHEFIAASGRASSLRTVTFSRVASSRRTHRRPVAPLIVDVLEEIDVDEQDGKRRRNGGTVPFRAGTP